MVHADIPGGKSAEQVKLDAPNLFSLAMWKFCLPELFILTCNFPVVKLINLIVKMSGCSNERHQPNPLLSATNERTDGE